MRDDNSRDAMVTKVLYSLDGKQLFSIGIGVGRRWDSETGAEADEFANFGAYASPHQAALGRPQSGPDQPAEGSENFPVELYTSKACDEQGMNYATYAGRWDTLPDFDELTPVVQGVLNHIDSGASDGRSASLAQDHQEGRQRSSDRAPLELESHRLPEGQEEPVTTRFR